MNQMIFSDVKYSGQKRVTQKEKCLYLEENVKKNTTGIIAIAFWMLFMMVSIALADYDPIIVHVGDYAFQRSQVMEALDIAVSIYESSGNEIGADTLEQLKGEVVQTFVDQAILENKIHELKLDVLTAEDEIALNQKATEAFETYKAQYADAIMEQYGCDKDKALRAAPVFMDLEGLTLLHFREQAENQLRRERITQYVCKNVARLTQDEIQAWYEENYVAPYRERYARDITTFETEVVLGGGQTFYIPEGYRIIQNIVFTPSEEETEQAYLLRERLARAQAEEERLERALYGVRLLGEDDTKARQELEDGQATVEAIKAEIAALYERMAEPFAARVEELGQRLRAGEDFLTLREIYDTNPNASETGYLVRDNSTVWEESYRDAAMQLNQPGDWCGPVLTGGGVQFLLYMEDAPQGAYPIEKAGLQAVTDAAQADADNRLLLKYAEIWKADYEIETHPELLILR